jgi:hypothetical protein
MYFSVPRCCFSRTASLVQSCGLLFHMYLSRSAERTYGSCLLDHVDCLSNVFRPAPGWSSVTGVVLICSDVTLSVEVLLNSWTDFL